MILPVFITNTIAALERAGHSAYLVGGALRDYLRGVLPCDFDIATSAMPHEVHEVFHDKRVVDTGIAHGTVTVFCDENAVEITTLRRDGDYIDHRRPTSVSLGASLIDDLARRDFTINAMAFGEGEIIDPFGGKNDLSAGIIRCVGDPDARFREDALRIIRALRFAATLGFSLDPTTAKAAFDNKHLLQSIAAERLFAELTKLLCGEFCQAVIVDYIDILAEIIPELLAMKDFCQHSPHHAFDVLTHTAKTVALSPPIAEMRVAALLHDIAKPMTFYRDETGRGHFKTHARKGGEMANQCLLRLKTSRSLRERVVILIDQHAQHIFPQPSRIKRLLARLGEEVFFQLIALQVADNSAKGTDCRQKLCELEESRVLAQNIIAEAPCFSLKDLAVRGDELGLCGRQIGEALQFLLNEVIEGRVENQREKLIKRSAEIRNQESVIRDQ